jgi:hypothetical protein
MTQSAIQPSFSEGEISPSLYGRVDFQGYYKGLRTCRNMIVSKYGGVDNRPGTRFVSLVNNSTLPVRLIPFQFNTATKQTCVLEFGDKTMRVVLNGAIVTSGGFPVVVQTPWAASDLSLLKFTQSADVVTVCHPNYPVQQINRFSNTNWTVTPFVNTGGPFQDVNINKANTVVANAVSGDITVMSSQDLFTPDLVGLLFYMGQSPDNSTVAWEVNKTTSINDIVIFGNNYYQALESGTTGTVGPTVIDGTQRDGNPGVLWQYLHSGFGIVKITGYIDSKNVTATVQSRIPDSLVQNTAPFTITNVIAAFDPTPVKVTVASPVDFATGDTVVISGVTGIAGANGTFAATVIDSLNFYLDNNMSSGIYAGGGTAVKSRVASPSYNWALPAWGSSQGYPATTAYFQDRQLFGASNGAPFNIWFSRTAGFLDFGQGNPVLDNDAITFKLLSNQVAIIKHMLELAYLIVFTSAGPYMVRGGQNGEGAITPSTIDLKNQGSNPCSDVPPIKINNYGVFVQEKGYQVRTIGYSFAENAFVGQDTTTMSSHLFQFDTVVSWAYQETPYSCIWVVMASGALLGLTFFPEQQVTAWHRHDTAGKFESVCCITEGNEDVVYFSVDRPGIGRCIERLVSRQFDSQVDAYFVDCGLSYDGRDAGTKATLFSGLDHLEGQTVSILADGMVYPDQVVVNGRVSIDTPAQVVHVGLPYQSDFETLALANQGTRDKKKAVNCVSLLVDRTSGIMAGPDADNLRLYPTRSTENYGEPDNLLSGLFDINIPCEWNKEGRIFVRQDKPLPITILSAIPQFEAGGN